jgi:hypothetical protein
MVSKANCESVCEAFGPSYVYQWRTNCKGCMCTDYSKYVCNVPKAACTTRCTSIAYTATWRASVKVGGVTCTNACKCKPPVA